jgi:hypothetical protein
MAPFLNWQISGGGAGASAKNDAPKVRRYQHQAPAALLGLFASSRQLLHQAAFTAGSVVLVNNTFRDRLIQLAGSRLHGFLSRSDVACLNRLAGSLGEGPGLGADGLVELPTLIVLANSLLG